MPASGQEGPIRRANWKATAPQLVPITIDGREHLVPRNLVRAYERGLLTPEP